MSILKLHEGIFEVISTGGDTHLGGDGIDNLLIAIALDDIAGDVDLGFSRADRRAGAGPCARPSSRPRSPSQVPTETKLDVLLPNGKP